MPFEIPIWPAGGLPEIPEAETYQVRSEDPDRPNGAVQYVSTPTLSVYLPPEAKGAVPAVVICPGGAYVRIAIDKEGVETARWLNRLGLAAIVLKYRMPRPEISGLAELPWPLQDGLRAMRTVRANAEAWKIDPRRIGIMGFSAGGHLASYVAGQPAREDASSADAIERESARPDFLMLIYPVTALQEVHGTRQALLGEGAETELVEAYSTETRVHSKMAPTFAIHAKDDGSVPFQDTLAFQRALERVGVPCEVHLYEQGGHAFGLEGAGEAGRWPDRCEAWLESRGLLGE